MIITGPRIKAYSRVGDGDMTPVLRRWLAAFIPCPRLIDGGVSSYAPGCMSARVGVFL